LLLLLLLSMLCVQLSLVPVVVAKTVEEANVAAKVTLIE
jgi:hypothetical protein